MTAPRPHIPRCRDCGITCRTLRWRNTPTVRRLETYPRRQLHQCVNGQPLCGRDVPGIRWENP